ncbi:MAG TPA: hypothetical protein VN939_00560 [Chthoniobacterales bacterium]|nr:hypothetical protein [Chthoniobacterales bacterium]
MRITLFIAGLIASGLLSATGGEPQNASLPEIKATIRFHSDAYGNVPDEIELPASTLLESKERRVIEGGLGRLPVRIYIRETPKQPRPAIEVNIVNTQTNKPLTGYPTPLEVGPLGLLSLNVPLMPTDLETLVHTAKKSAEGKLGKVDGVSLHIDVDIPVNPETNSDGDVILDCQDLLRQDQFVVDDVSQKINDTSTHGVRSVADAYTGCLNQQTQTLINGLKADDKKTIERIRQLLPDLAPVSFDSAVNQNGGTYFSMLALASVGVDTKQAETINRLAKQLAGSAATNPGARKAVSTAFASCQATLKDLVAAPEDAGEDVNVADLKKEFQSSLAKAKAALKDLQEIASKLPDNSAMLLAQSTFSILTTPQGFE